MAKKNARNTRGRIVNAAWKLFYEQGYEDTTVEEIIDLSKTSKGSFYHYFDGKDALLSTLSTLFDEKYEELIEQLEAEDISLEDAFTAYSKGMNVLKQCNEQIDRVEKQVMKLNEEGGLEPLDPQ